MIKSIQQLNKEEIQGKKVLVRVDFNVPVQDGKVVDDYRIVRALPTINFLKENGAKILLISHIEIKDVETPSLRPVFDYLSEKFSLSFIEDCFGEEAVNRISSLGDGEIILFENIRRYEGEKKNDEVFGKQLADLAEIYVNDAFAVSHREHASVVGVPKYLPSYAGLLLSDEIAHLSIGENTPHPFLFIIGGAKFDTKLPLIEKFLEKADKVFVGGALVNDILKAKGYEIGKSLVSETSVDLAYIISNPKVIIPVDVITESGVESQSKVIGAILKDDVIVDVGEETISLLEPEIAAAKYILWNGPMGNYEKGFKEGTVALSKLIGGSKAESVVGGGDTLASIKELNLMDEFTFISTGGGAMLDLLLNGTLPGIQALDK